MVVSPFLGPPIMAVVLLVSFENFWFPLKTTKTRGYLEHPPIQRGATNNSWAFRAHARTPWLFSGLRARFQVAGGVEKVELGGRPFGRLLAGARVSLMGKPIQKEVSLDVPPKQPKELPRRRTAPNGEAGRELALLPGHSGEKSMCGLRRKVRYSLYICWPCLPLLVTHSCCI